jgi:hypothetical protein
MHVEALKAGWKGTPGDTRDHFELLKRMRQAGIDGQLRFWGKRVPFAWNKDMVSHAPLIPIEKVYWIDHEIEAVRAIYMQNNAEIYSEKQYQGDRDTTERFYDLHLDRQEALDWLRGEGAPSDP